MPSVGTRPVWGLQSGVIIVSTQGLLLAPSLPPQDSVQAFFTGAHHGTQTNQEWQEKQKVELDERTLNASQSGCLKKL